MFWEMVKFLPITILLFVFSLLVGCDEPRTNYTVFQEGVGQVAVDYCRGDRDGTFFIIGEKRFQASHSHKMVCFWEVKE